MDTPPIEHIELSDRRFKRRLAASIIFGLIAVAMVGYIVINLLIVEPGLRIVEAERGESCAGDLVLMYDFGKNATALHRRLTRIYTDAAQTAYRLFSSDKTFEGMNNIRSLNLHPNETLEVPPALYDALGLFERYEDRSIYLAPIYAEYSSLFFSSYDYEAAQLDPGKNAEQAAYFAEIAAFAADPSAVELELLGEARVRLRVSPEYLAFAKENGIDCYIDLFWLQNAFSVDYIADALAEAGFTDGQLTSFDGYSRSLGKAELTYRIYDREGNTVYPAALVSAGGGTSLVSFRDFMLNELDSRFFYEYDDGRIISRYIAGDGFDRVSMHALTVFSPEKGCAELLISTLPAYIAPEFDAALLRDGYVYSRGTELVCSGDLDFTELFQKNGQEYTITRVSD